MSLGDSSIVRSTVPDQTEVRGVWTGGGVGTNCTRSPADANRGIVSVVWNAATGKYRMTLTDVGQQILDAMVNISRPAGSIPLTANVIRGSLNVAAKTVDFEVWSVSAGSHVATDILATDKLQISVVFTKNSP